MVQREQRSNWSAGEVNSWEPVPCHEIVSLHLRGYHEIMRSPTFAEAIGKDPYEVIKNPWASNFLPIFTPMPDGRIAVSAFYPPMVTITEGFLQCLNGHTTPTKPNEVLIWKPLSS